MNIYRFYIEVEGTKIKKTVKAETEEAALESIKNQIKIYPSQRKPIPTKRPLSEEEGKKIIIGQVTEYLGIPEEKIYRKTRKTEVVYARFLIYRLLYDNARITKRGIGELFGKDHTTVIHGMKALSDLEETDPKVAFDIEFLNQKICA